MLPPPETRSDLPALLKALDARRAAFLEALDALPGAALERAPAPEAWSPLQIGEHLLRTEEQMLGAAERQTHSGSDRRVLGEADEAAVEGLILSLRSPARFRVPASARGIHPDGSLSLQDLRARWGAAAERWRRLVAAFPPGLLNVALLRHPLAGPLCMRHALRFLEAHIAHHEHQLNRTVQALEPARRD
jgi:hypothetical protein